MEMSGEVIFGKVLNINKNRWISQGSEAEILVEKDPSIRTIVVAKPLFRTERDINLSDQNASDSVIQFESFDYPEPLVRFTRTSKAIQAAPAFQSNFTQTTLCYPRHAFTQYEARTFDEKTALEHLNSPGLMEVLPRMVYRMECALTENEILNPFTDHWAGLGPLPESFQNLLEDSSLTASQSIQNDEICNGKMVTCISCHPQKPGILGAGYAEKLTFEERLDRLPDLQLREKFALLWRTTTPLTPLCILEAPDDVMCLEFSPYDSHLIAAGCLNGKIVVWNLTLVDFGGETLNQVLKPATSTPDDYWGCVRRLEWVPPFLEFSSKGISPSNPTRRGVQLFSCSTDGWISVWDLKPTSTTGRNPKLDPHDTPLGPSMKRVLRVFPSVKEKRRDLAIINFTMLDPASAQSDKITESLGTSFPSICLLGTEEGEVVIADWKTCTETEKGMACRVPLCLPYHDGPVTSILVSPYFSQLALTVGGHTWALWRTDEQEGPLLQPPRSNSIITSACWSPWNCTMIVLGLENGHIEIWNLLNSFKRPARTLYVWNVPVSVVRFGIDYEGSKVLLSAGVGDEAALKIQSWDSLQLDANRNPEEDMENLKTLLEHEKKHQRSLREVLGLSEAKDKAALMLNNLKSFMENGDGTATQPAPPVKKSLSRFMDIEASVLQNDL